LLQAYPTAAREVDHVLGTAALEEDATNFNNTPCQAVGDSRFIQVEIIYDQSSIPQ
jgi:hypothetical protein